MSALPAYSFLLGLIALLGFMAIAAGVKPVVGANGKPDANTVVPVLFDQMFPDWFAGVAYAAIGIGALVPAAIMSIAAANLFTRNIYREYLNKDATDAQEAKVSKLVSLVVKVGAVLCILILDPQFSIDLQLIGGVIILQTLPSVALGLYTRWFHKSGLIAGWAFGLAAGLWMLYLIPNPANGKAHFGGSAFSLGNLGFDTTMTIYAGFLALGVNLLVAALGTWLFRALKVADGVDATTRTDYFADEGDPKVKPMDLTGTHRHARPASPLRRRAVRIDGHVETRDVLCEDVCFVYSSPITRSTARSAWTTQAALVWCPVKLTWVSSLSRAMLRVASRASASLARSGSVGTVSEPSIRETFAWVRPARSANSA